MKTDGNRGGRAEAGFFAHHCPVETAPFKYLIGKSLPPVIRYPLGPHLASSCFTALLGLGAFQLL